MVVTSGTDLVTDGLLLAGVGDQYNAADASSTKLAQRLLNDMLDSWSGDPLLVYQIVEGIVPVTVNVNTVSIPGGTIATNPSEFIRASIVDAQNNTYPCDIIGTDEWSRIQYKPAAGRPYCVYFDYGQPTCTASLYPTPAFANDTLHIWYPKDLQNFSALTDLLVAPQGYSLSIKCAVARLFCAAFKLDPTNELRRQERIAVRTARLGHIQPTTLPPVFGSGRYNIYTDRYNP